MHTRTTQSIQIGDKNWGRRVRGLPKISFAPAGAFGILNPLVAKYQCPPYGRPIICVHRQVCWMAESSQSPPRARMKVHNSVTSLRSPPSTVHPLARSTIASLSANFIATVA